MSKEQNSEKHTNSLINSSSPYLLQHAHNPVDWYPWGEEAIEKAVREDKPIFLSIGYSACYWCHVMEREVFENEKIAAQMNDCCVNIKVDREERPDIDEIYMIATHIISGRGGWPNNLFLTPDLKPFFAGTYFGAKDTPGRPGFPTLLKSISEGWKGERENINASAQSIAKKIRRISKASETEDEAPDVAVTDNFIAHLSKFFDERNGGFYLEPKFPNETTLLFLLEHYKSIGNMHSLNMAVTTLDSMAAGGIYDHVGGGFHRYSVDKYWHVPHFEKMLYNQALLARAYTELHKISENPYHKSVVEGIFSFVKERLTTSKGAFYSAMDAETDSVEGAYYVWQRADIEESISADEAKIFDNVYEIVSVPEFSGHKHPDGGALVARKPLSEAAIELGMTYVELRGEADNILTKLKKIRDKRNLPRLDDKILVGWNGLMIDAYARAGMAFGDIGHIVSARKAADFVLKNMRDKRGLLYRVYAKNKAYIYGYSEDYAYFIQGLVSLYEANGKKKYLDAAQDLVRVADELFSDKVNGGYFFTDDKEKLIVRTKKATDGAIPSANAVFANVFLDLHRLTGKAEWYSRAKNILRSFSRELSEKPESHASLSQALLRFGKKTEQATNVDNEVKSGNDDVVVVTAGRVSGDELLVTIDIADGWHINANPASMEFLVPTSVDVRGDGVEVLAIDYPTSNFIDSPLSNIPLAIYEGRVAIPVKINESDAEKPLRVLVRYQPCKDVTCLEPRDEVIILHPQQIL